MEENLLVDVEVEDAKWLIHVPDTQQRVLAAVIATFDHLKPDIDVDIVVLLTDDDEMRALNAQFRQKNAPTNVLAFPSADYTYKIAAQKSSKTKSKATQHLGDIALGFETCFREASEQKKSLQDHLTHLTVHGVLHLLGFDHELADEAHAMEALEIEILATLGVTDPYLQVLD
jgi:probable rRNA maturation factor